MDGASVSGDENGIPVFVMLPLDILDYKHEVHYGQDSTINQEEALKIDLVKLVGVGVKGVMVDCWWGRVEAKGQGEYYWEGYKTLFKIVSETGLDLHVVMSFHACKDVQIPLPKWVTDIGNGNSDIFYKDYDANPDPEYLSWGVDGVLLENGLTTIKVYKKFMKRFRTEMSAYFGEPQEGESTKKGKITKIEVGLGPSGELRYPAYRRTWRPGPPAGIGEFQCYDQYMTRKWDEEATNQGFTIPWRVGPQTAGNYNSRPWETQFFRGAGLTNGISYSETHGKTFLNWYSKNLVDHGRKVLEIAGQIFKPVGVEIAAKVPGIYWYCNDPSRAAEATAGLFAGDNLSVYLRIAGMLQEMGATFIFTCVEKENDPGNQTDKPQQLVDQVLGAAQSKRASIACENASAIAYKNASPEDQLSSYDRIIKAAIKHKISYFTYLRLDPELIENATSFELFKEFVKGMNERTPIKSPQEASPSAAQGP